LLRHLETAGKRTSNAGRLRSLAPAGRTRHRLPAKAINVLLNERPRFISPESKQWLELRDETTNEHLDSLFPDPE
jgi:hypothetical protein